MPRMACIATARPVMLCVTAAGGIRPGLIEHDRLLEGDLGNFRRDAPNGRRIDTTAVGNRFRRILRIEVTLREQREGRSRATPVRQRKMPVSAGIDARCPGIGQRSAAAVECELATGWHHAR